MRESSGLGQPPPKHCRYSLDVEPEAMLEVDLVGARIRGEKTYKTALRTFDGRDNIMDIREELVDLIQYVAKEVKQRDMIRQMVNDIWCDIQSDIYCGLEQKVRILHELLNEHRCDD